MQGMGIGPAKRPARDTLTVGGGLMIAERALLSRWTRGPMQGMGIGPAKRSARDSQMLDVALSATERAKEAQ
jgi:hypothetical protein